MSDDETGAPAAPPAHPSRAAGMSSDAKWIIGTIVPAIPVVAGLLSAQIAGGNASLNRRIDDLSDTMNARFDDVHRRIDDMQADIRELRALIFEAFKPDEPAD